MEANVLVGVPVESLRVYTYSRTAARARKALWEKDLPASAVVLLTSAVGSSAVGSNVVSHGRNTNARVIHI